MNSNTFKNWLTLPQRSNAQVIRRGGVVSVARMRGLTLIELMIAMLLGLIVIGSASAIFLSNRQTYRATEALGRVQESSRMAFELMARDVREAAGNPCAKNLPMANVLNSPASRWWTNWNNGIRGYEDSVAMPDLPTGTAYGNRIAGTDAVELMSGDNSSALTIVSHNPTSANFQLNTDDHELYDGDIAIVCDFRQAVLFQVTNANTGSSDAIVHNNGNTETPGNCSKGLGFPTDCSGAVGNRREFGANSMIVRLHAARWYIGRGENGRNSLFRSSLVNEDGVVGPVAEQIVDGVDNMTLTYLIRDADEYVNATAVAANRWRDVVAVRIDLDLASADRAGVGNVALQRTLSHTVAIRNRIQ